MELPTYGRVVGHVAGVSGLFRPAFYQADAASKQHADAGVGDLIVDVYTLAARSEDASIDQSL